MTEQDRVRFAEGLAILSEMLPPRRALSAIQVKGYWWALKDMPLEQFVEATHAAMRDATFLPTPAELRRLVTGSTEDGAALAWGQLLREVRRVGYLGAPTLPENVMSTVRNTWGSWSKLCKTLPGDGPELVGWMKRFSSTYGAVERQGQTDRLLSPSTVHPSIQALIDAPKRKSSGFRKIVENSPEAQEGGKA
jgi:hypothetical protein|tara:strand:+ start:593 stop:1171 length:579 start_codon:yes stop_codon:yes gene_type:complete